MFGLGNTEILLIFLLILLLFGGKKLPELARGLGKGIREFKKAAREVDDDITVTGEEEEKPDETNIKPPHEV
jgi:sec-independent protein translocase protein TatA